MAVLLTTITPKKFVALFKGRTDRVMIYSRGKQISQQVKRGEFELITRAEAHLNGQARLGFYNMLDDMTVPWVQVVFEEGGTSKNTLKDSLLLMRELTKLGINSVRRERTLFKGENYNVWIFLDPPIAAKKVRYFLFKLFEKLGFPQETPIIPATDTLAPGDFGYSVWLPYFNGIDKWMNEENMPFDGLGVKQDCTIFLDEENKTIDKNIMVVPRSSERDIDQALNALAGPMGNKYLPGVGLHIDDSTIQKFLNSCEGFANIIKQIETKGSVSDEGLVQLGVLLKTLGHEKLFEDYTSKLKVFEDKKIYKLMDKYEGPLFPECLTLKQMEFCPPGKVCFNKTAPLTEKLGFWKEDKNADKNLEPTTANWLYKAAAEYEYAVQQDDDSFSDDDIPLLDVPGASSAKAAPVVKVEVEPISSFLEEFTENMEKKRSEKKDKIGLNSGFDVFNELIGGLIPGSLILLGGDSGSGKSAFAKQLLDQTADKENRPCIYISYGLSQEDLHLKTTARLTGLAYRQLKSAALNDADWAKLAKINKYIKDKLGNLIYIFEADETINTTAILQAAEKSDAAFVVLDYLQAMPPPPRENISDMAMRNIMNLSALKRICRSKEIPLLVISNGEVHEEMKYHCDLYLKLIPRITPQIAATANKPYISLLNVEKNTQGISKVTLQYNFFPPRMTYYGEKQIEYAG